MYQDLKSHRQNDFGWTPRVPGTMRARHDEMKAIDWYPLSYENTGEMNPRILGISRMNAGSYSSYSTVSRYINYYLPG